MIRLSRKKGEFDGAILPRKGSIIDLMDLMDCTIQAYFRLSDDEFLRFFKGHTKKEMNLLIPPEETTQSFSDRRKVSKLLDKFYNKRKTN